jgi:integration host factor subunit alpha
LRIVFPVQSAALWMQPQLEVAEVIALNPSNHPVKSYTQGDAMALTKSEIVDRVHEMGLTKKNATAVIESLLEIIKGSLATGDDVLVSGFGKFSVKEKHSRRGRNPATGSDLMLRRRKVVTFKCSGKLRDKINLPD